METQTYFNCDVVLNDISDVMMDARPSALSVDLETDPCNFENPRFWDGPISRVITVFDPVRSQAELVRVDEDSNPRRLRELMSSAQVTFHHAMFDMTFLRKDFGIRVMHPRCTYILARALRAAGELRDVSIGLKSLLREYLDVEYPSNEALSDWQAPQLSPNQIEYAVLDVEHLHTLYSAMQDHLWSVAPNDMLWMVKRHQDHLPVMVESRIFGLTGVFEHLR